MTREFDSKSWTGMDDETFDLNKLFGTKSAIRNSVASAWKWFTDKLKNTGRVSDTKKIGLMPQNRESIIHDKQRARKINSIGQMYFFIYDPKHKKTLPYYDKFPLVFPIEFYPDGFLGINFHYLDYGLRAKLLAKLVETMTNKRFDETTKLKISYEILKGLGTMHQPCVKRYLNAHVRSQFIWIDPREWKQAIFLPVENFAKSTKEQVWRDSKGRI